jgi:hypothetical protein
MRSCQRSNTSLEPNVESLFAWSEKFLRRLNLAVMSLFGWC